MELIIIRIDERASRDSIQEHLFIFPSSKIA